MIEHSELVAAADEVLGDNGDRWPWDVIGVFPVQETLDETDGQPQWWSSFCYTVGLNDYFELWTPCQSIEGRYAGNQLVGMFLNMIAAGFRTGVVSPGATLRLPIGMPGGDDADSIWWVGENLDSAQRRSVNMSPRGSCLPILWSSPLGWPDE